jgi:hypothetical protein
VPSSSLSGSAMATLDSRPRAAALRSTFFIFILRWLS